MKHEWTVTHKPATPKDPDGVDCAQCGLKALRWGASIYITIEETVAALFGKKDAEDIPRVDEECRGRPVHIMSRDASHTRCGLELMMGPDGTYAVRSLEKYPEEGRHATCWRCRNSCHLCGGENTFLNVKECSTCWRARRNLLRALYLKTGVDLGKALSMSDATGQVARGWAYWLLRGPEPLLCLVDKDYVPAEGETPFLLPLG